jgi:hypothetical protein
MCSMSVRESDWAGTGYETGMMATQVFDYPILGLHVITVHQARKAHHYCPFRVSSKAVQV